MATACHQTCTRCRDDALSSTLENLRALGGPGHVEPLTEGVLHENIPTALFGIVGKVVQGGPEPRTIRASTRTVLYGLQYRGMLWGQSK